MSSNTSSTSQDASSNSIRVESRWVDDFNENPSWEETLNDPLLQRFLRKSDKNAKTTHDAEYKKNNPTERSVDLTFNYQDIAVGIPFSDIGISIRDKKLFYKKKQKENRRRNAEKREADAVKQIEDDLFQALEFEVKYMKIHKLPLYQSVKFIACLNDIDRLIRGFLLDGQQKQLSLCAMCADVRTVIKNLLVFYNVSSSVRDKKSLKHLTLYKSKNSQIPQWDKKEVQFDQFHPSGVVFNSPPLSKVINELHRKWVKSCHQDVKYLKFSELRFADSCKKDIEVALEVKPNKIVGEDAPEITENNVGFRMLQKMGWSPANPDSEGPVGANPIPIKVVIRPGKSGLGFGS